MELNLKGKKALICASSKGLGFAVAKSLHGEGCEILMCSRDLNDLKSAAEKIAGLSPQYQPPSYLDFDLSNPSNIDSFATQALERLGQVDILVNNIGGPPPSSAEMTSREQWQKGFDQIFMSAVLLTQALLPSMKKNKFGRVITVTSLSVFEPIEHLVVSTAMRTAVTAFMKTLSKETAQFGITANTVLPGVIHTDRIINLRKAKAARDKTTLESELEKTKNSIPMGRLGEPEELADLVTFLASERASYITGVNIPVDGGLRHSWA
jgi:3-oxoacyl-[acyl-carrier protein] reductase